VTRTTLFRDSAEKECAGFWPNLQLRRISENPCFQEANKVGEIVLTELIQIRCAIMSKNFPLSTFLLQRRWNWQDAPVHFWTALQFVCAKNVRCKIGE